MPFPPSSPSTVPRSSAAAGGTSVASPTRSTGQLRGTYLLVYFAVDTQAVAAIRRDLQFNESLLRWLLVDCPEVPQGAYEPEADFDVNAIPSDDAPASAPVVEAAPEAVEATADTTTSTEA
jgi:hypothetical protein